MAKFNIGDIVKGISDKHPLANTNMTKGEVVIVDCYRQKIGIKVLEVADKEKAVESSIADLFCKLASVFADEEVEKPKAGDYIDSVVEGVPAEWFELVEPVSKEEKTENRYIRVEDKGDSVIVYDSKTNDTMTYHNGQMPFEDKVDYLIDRWCKKEKMHAQEAKPFNGKFVVVDFNIPEATDCQYKRGDIITVKDGKLLSKKGNAVFKSTYYSADEVINVLGKTFKVVQLNEGE